MRRHTSFVSALLVFSAATSLAQTGASWPQFRGPNRDNISPDKGLLKQWPASGPPLVWKATGLGGGYSSVSIAGGKAYTLGNRGADSYLVAIDQSNGNILWSTKVGRAGDNLGSTPTVDGNRIYAIGQRATSSALMPRTAPWSGGRTFNRTSAARVGDGATPNPHSSTGIASSALQAPRTR